MSARPGAHETAPEPRRTGVLGTWTGTRGQRAPETDDEADLAPGPGRHFGSDLSTVPVHDGGDVERHPGIPAGRAESTIRSMERAYRMPFDGVRLRADDDAGRRAAAMGALAWTDGAEVGFAPSGFDPTSHQGRLTIAHEFAHLAQLRGGTPGASAGDPVPAGALGRSLAAPAAGRGDLEAAAERAAHLVVDGHEPVLGAQSAAGLLGRDAPAAAPTPERPALGVGQARHYVDGEGRDHYVFLLDDVQRWGPEFLFHILWHYFLGHYQMSGVPDREALVRAFIAHYPSTIQSSITLGTRAGAGRRPAVAADGRPREYDLLMLPDLTAAAQRWMTATHPEVPAYQRELLAPGEPARLRKFEPLGELLLEPEPGGTQTPSYVAGSRSTVVAVVHFDPSLFDRNQLNAAPHGASFAWRVLRGDKKVDGGPVFEQGAIRYEVDLPDPGLYTIEVTVSSPQFSDGRLLTLTRVVRAEEESRRVAAAFATALVGTGPTQSFTRGSDGALRVDEDAVPQDIESQIFVAKAAVAAISKLASDGRLSGSDAKAQLDVLKEELAGLEEARRRLGPGAGYVVDGVFVDRQTSATVRVSMVARPTLRRAAFGAAVYEITLFDFTLAPGKPDRHVGVAVEPEPPDRPPDWAALEERALQDLADHIHSYNDYPYGSMRLAIGRHEQPGVAILEVDTYNWKRTGSKVLTGIAVVGGVVLIGVGAFTGGATAGVGVWIVAGAGMAVAANNINDRLQRGHFGFDAQLALDLAAFVPVVGSLSTALRTSKLLLNGMNLLTLSGTMVAMRQEVIHALLTIDAHYNVDRARVLAELDAARAAKDDAKVTLLQQRLVELERTREDQRATVIGQAAVSGGLVLVQLGATVAAGRLARPPTVTDPPPSTRTTRSTTTSPPVETTPVETSPVETSPVETTPVDTTPTDSEPVPKPTSDLAPPSAAGTEPGAEVPLTPSQKLQATLSKLATRRRAVLERLQEVLRQKTVETERLRARAVARSRRMDELQTELRRARDPESRAAAKERINAFEDELGLDRERLEELDADALTLGQEMDAIDLEVRKERFPFTRDPLDLKISGRPADTPKALTGRGVGTTPNQAAELKHLLKNLPADASDVRIDELQVDGNRLIQGRNEPDLQYTSGGKRYYVELEQMSNPRGLLHARRILKNDPTGIVEVRRVPTTEGFVPGSDAVKTESFTIDNIVLTGDGE